MNIGKYIALVVFVPCLLAFRPPANAAAAENGDARAPIRTIEDLNRKRLGVLKGTSLDDLANSSLDFTQIHYFENARQQIEALEKGEIDAIIDDMPVTRHLVANTPSLALLPGVLMEDDYAFAMRQGDDELYNKINAALKELLANGTVAKLEKRWLDGETTDDAQTANPPKKTAGRIIRYGVSTISPPFCHEGPDGKPAGLELDLMRIIADRLNMRLEVTDMEFGELIPSLVTDETDIVSSCISVTEERKQVVHFTDPYFHGGVTAIVLKNR